MSAATCCVPSCGTPALPDADRCKPHQQKRRAAARRRARDAGDPTALGRVGTRCQRRHCRAVCGGRLEAIVDRATGRVIVACPLCDRQAAGLCRDCPRRLAAKQALRCPDCAARHQKSLVARWYYDNPERAKENGERWRSRVLADPVRGPQFVQRERAYQVEYRKGGWWSRYMRGWRRRKTAELRAQTSEVAA